MNNNEKIDPKTLLRAIEKKQNKTKGRLKVFLGMSAGVGKTYAMLELALKKIKEGFDVATGVICTHGRKDTQKLAESIRVIEEKTLYYKDKPFKELNLEEIIKQKPDIVLIDELAHTNIEGSKHPKRWQDVLEVLDNGIDVYTTVNIQHIESCKGIVEQISGVIIRETVPDKILENADNIEVIDLTPQELIERFKEGKVYTGQMPITALQNFFKEENLTALRELALRFSADVVDEELHRMTYPNLGTKNWNQREKLLVLVNEKSESEELLRITKRMAFALHAPWIALYIDNGEKLNDDEGSQLYKNLSLARELGAEVITFPCLDILEGVSKIVNQKHVSQIYLYKTILPFWERLKASFIDRLALAEEGVDIHLVRKATKSRQEEKKDLFTKKLGLINYFKALLIVILLSITSFLLLPLIGYKSIIFLFLLIVMGMGFFFSKGPLLTSSILFVLIWSYFFVPQAPFEIFVSFQDLILAFLFLVTSIALSLITSKARDKEKILQKRETSLTLINDVIKEIAEAKTFKDVFSGVKEKVGLAFDGVLDIILNPLESTTIFENDKEKAVACYSFENGVEAGFSTNTLPSVKNLYIPLKSYKGIIGVLAFQSNDGKALLPKQLNFLHTISSLLANYFERHFSEEKERQAQMQREIDKTHSIILATIANKLSKPLENIQESLDKFCDYQKEKDDNKYLSNILSSLSTLRSISQNAYAMAGLSSGLLNFQKEASDISKIIQNACKNLEDSLKPYHLIINIQENLPLIICDKDLLEVCLINFLTNSADNAPSKTNIEIEAKISLDSFILAVLDEGPGISEEKQNEIFDKFYTIPGSPSKGLGLGLSIAQSIATIHNAKIEVVNRLVRGLKVSFVMPI